jgi:GNAT superfamily N-acetyltransferase
MNAHLGIRILSVFILFLVFGCKAEKMSTLEVGKTATVTLKGSAYRIEWVRPNTPPTWGSVRIRAEGSYEEHVHPLYNLQEDIPSDPPENEDWGGVWEQIAGGLASKVEWFALAAYDQDKLAGMIRFFPKTITRPRYGAWSPDDHRQEWTDEILWIGGAYVDFRGAEDGLDTELVRRVVQYARQEGYAKIQGLGWSDIRAYAMWGQSFPVSVYDGLGFRRIATVDGSGLHALPDMLAGHHGEDTQQQVKAAMESQGFTQQKAEEFYMVELNCK